MDIPTLENAALLEGRSVLSLTGDETEEFLQGLVTSDLARLSDDVPLPTALLSPQGKILADFLVWKRPDGVWLDCSSDVAADLLKRLKLYKLRAKIGLEDLTESHGVYALPDVAPTGVPDPRLPALGRRAVLVRSDADSVLKTAATGLSETPAAFEARRWALGVAECGGDFAPDRIFALEANYAELGSVDFKKGCFVGQEVTARMHHKTVLRKRLWPVSLAEDVETGTPVLAGETSVGSIEGIAGTHGFALLRLDRLADAGGRAAALTATGHPVELGAPPWADLEAALSAAMGG